MSYMGFLEKFDKYTPTKFSDVGGYTLYLSDYTTRVYKTKDNKALKFSTFSAASCRSGNVASLGSLMSRIENPEEPEDRIYS